MKVLVACEYSGAVREAFRRLGHDAVSCDLLPSEVHGPHYQGDVADILCDGWDLMVAHPPCTHLAVSGSRWFKDKVKEQAEALDFVRLLMGAPIAKIAVENPISVISSRIRKPDQIIQPFQFGHTVKKSTCLWLNGLPLLTPTEIVTPEITTLKTGARFSTWDYNISMDRKNRSKLRSKTFPGVANAMASQWSK